MLEFIKFFEFMKLKTSINKSSDQCDQNKTAIEEDEIDGILKEFEKKLDISSPNEGRDEN